MADVMTSLLVQGRSAYLKKPNQWSFGINRNSQYPQTNMRDALFTPVVLYTKMDASVIN